VILLAFRLRARRNFRAGTAPKPDVITDCPTTFGNTDIFLGTVSY
jgi:hypothetical protein